MLNLIEKLNMQQLRDNIKCPYSDTSTPNFLPTSTLFLKLIVSFNGKGVNLG